MRGIHRWPVKFPSKRPVTRSFGVSLIYAWTNGWVNNGDDGGLRRHRAHYDVVVMYFISVARYIRCRAPQGRELSSTWYRGYRWLGYNLAPEDLQRSYRPTPCQVSYIRSATTECTLNAMYTGTPKVKTFPHRSAQADGNYVVDFHSLFPIYTVQTLSRMLDNYMPHSLHNQWRI